MNDNLSQSAKNVLNNAHALAKNLGHTFVGSEHLLLSMLYEHSSIACKILNARGITYDIVKTRISQLVGLGDKISQFDIMLSPKTQSIIQHSRDESQALGHNYIGTEHLLLAMLKEDSCSAIKILIELGVNINLLYNDVLNLFAGHDPSAMNNAGNDNPAANAHNAKSGQSSGTPTINQYSKDLTAAAKAGKIDPIIGRDSEMERVIQILSRRTKNNPCLIGEPGVGKTAVAEGLAQKIIEDNVPDTLKNKRLLALDLSAMIAGAKYRGEFEERLKSVMEEIKKNPNIIIFIDEIHTIVGAGAAEGAVDAANILKPALARGDMQVIGATTIEEYRKHIEKDAALERRFQCVTVGEPTPEETIQILKGLRDKYEAHHKVKITDKAIEAAVKLSVRYITDRFLPDKAIDLIDEAASKARIGALSSPPVVKDIENELKKLNLEKEEAVNAQDFERAAKLRDAVTKLNDELKTKQSEWKNGTDKSILSIDDENIADIVTSWTNIPVRQMLKEEAEKLINLEETLKARVIGQDEAVSTVARAIRRSRVGLSDPKRPSGSFIFLGPTGVGKTELCKVLADVLFGSETAMIRVDMSEFMEKHSVSKFIGSPPGYVGYDDGNNISEKIRRKPYSIVLFDEIEKAHPDVFNILLQILEDGILTDAHGRKINFKNTVIIMTSNVGANALNESKQLGFSVKPKDEHDSESQNRNILDSLKNTFKPEFLNRIDEIIVFKRLNEDALKKITDNMLETVKKRINALNIDITFDESCVDLLIKEGYDPTYGARPMRRTIQRKIEDALSVQILDGRIKSGTAVTVTGENGEIVFKQ